MIIQNVWFDNEETFEQDGFCWHGNFDIEVEEGEVIFVNDYTIEICDTDSQKTIIPSAKQNKIIIDNVKQRTVVNDKNIFELCKENENWPTDYYQP